MNKILQLKALKRKALHTLQVFDCDGVLVDSSHRYRTNETGSAIDLPYWIDNEKNTHRDKLGNPKAIDAYLKAIRCPQTFVIIATARIWCGQSVEWLNKNLPQPDYIVSRQGREDTRKGASMKIQGIDKMIESREFWALESVVIHEDNASYLKQLCDYYNAQGIYYPSKQGH